MTKSGTDVMILSIISPHRKYGRFLLETLLLFKLLINTLAFMNNAYCFAENWRKSFKIVTIT
jgi:hypothetical protein